MDDLVTWLTAQLDEDELWALAASAPYHGNGPTVEGGVHWTWAVGGNWIPIEVDPTAEYVGEDQDDDDGVAKLVTREVFPLSRSSRPEGLNGRVLCLDDMVRTGDGGHIARHDPARVLAEVAAKRRIIELHREAGRLTGDGYRAGGFAWCETCGSGEPNEYPAVWPCETLKLVALPYADRPGYREEWAPAE